MVTTEELCGRRQLGCFDERWTDVKVIDFSTRKEQRQARSVPVLTFARGKFTLAVETAGQMQHLVVYNTTSKVEIARIRPPTQRRDDWIRWAEDIVRLWQKEHEVQP